MIAEDHKYPDNSGQRFTNTHTHAHTHIHMHARARAHTRTRVYGWHILPLQAIRNKVLLILQGITSQTKTCGNMGKRVGESLEGRLGDKAGGAKPGGWTLGYWVGGSGGRD